MKLISIVIPCYNEEGNLSILYERLCGITADLSDYRFEFIFIDNDSADRSRQILRDLSQGDRRVKLIFNARNFGPIRSPTHAMFEARGDAIILMVADLQDPPELIPKFLKHWEDGYKVALGIRTGSEENRVIFNLRRLYYWLVRKLSDVRLYSNFTGFGLYDRSVIQTIRRLDDPCPYFRGLISELGYRAKVETFHQPKRYRGITSTNFYSLYNTAMLGFTTHSKVPLRLAVFIGFLCSTCSFLVGLTYLVYKLLYWQEFNTGIAPLVIGTFFIGSIQIFFIGLVGEYILSIHTKVYGRPLVIEEERINFDAD